MKHSLIALSLVAGLCLSAACSRSSELNSEPNSEDSPTQIAEGDDAAVAQVVAAARALAEPEPSVDYVAARMEGAIKARTKSQALIHYDGYRATLTTPGDRVTRVTFDLVDARPSMEQLSGAFGEASDAPKGKLYKYESAVTGATIHILAQPVSMPADEDSLVQRIIVEGRRHR